MSILVTGGAGYIGSHSVLCLLEAGYKDLVIYDNLSNSSEQSLFRISEITGQRITLVKGEVRDKAMLGETIEKYHIKTVIHFAGLKAVGESVAKPLQYYDNNVYGTLVLLQAVAEHNIKQFVFSSSAAVYGNPEQLPIQESAPTGGLTNPYGKSKLHIEEMLKDLCIADPEFTVIALRYFNAVGAHENGKLGEAPAGVPSNLMPYVAQVAVGKLDVLKVYGNDYPTQDGTGVRDYVHVMDLARGHLQAIRKIKTLATGYHAINLGTGIGYSVLDIVRTFEKVSGKKINIDITPRRPGDIATCYAAVEKAKEMLCWTAEKDLEDICRDAWNWQVQSACS